MNRLGLDNSRYLYIFLWKLQGLFFQNCRRHIDYFEYDQLIWPCIPLPLTCTLEPVTVTMITTYMYIRAGYCDHIGWSVSLYVVITDNNVPWITHCTFLHK